MRVVGFGTSAPPARAIMTSNKRKPRRDTMGSWRRKTIPKQFIGTDWFSFEVLPLVIAYNKSIVKPAEVPKSYGDLGDPKWKGKVAIDANPDSLITAMVKKWGKEKTGQWLDKFINANQALLRSRAHRADPTPI